MGLLRLLKHDLAMETRTWVKNSLITEDQAAAICSTYGIDYHHMSQRSKGYWILVFLGYLFIGLALITLVSANWDRIPREIRMGGLILLTMATHGAGLVKIRRGRDLAGIGFFFLGSLFYGASIMLIAQIYHLGEHFPDGILFWALGVLPLALILQSQALMLLTAALAAIWFMVEAGMGYFPWLFPLFLAAMAWHLFRAGQSRLLFLSLIILTGLFFELSISWTMGGWDHLDVEIENLFFGAGWCLICYGLARFLARQDRSDVKDYASLLSLWVLRFFVFILFVLSFEEIWEELIRESWTLPGAALAGGGAMGILTLALAWMGDKTLKSLVVPGIGLLVFMGYMTGLIMVSHSETAIYFTIADNIILMVTGIWLVINGIRRAVSHYFFLGVVIILLTGLVRYIDLVGDYLGATAMFTGFAVILLGTARFWRARQKSKAPKGGRS